jgi:hypothetical protein
VKTLCLLHRPPEGFINGCNLEKSLESINLEDNDLGDGGMDKLWNLLFKLGERESPEQRDLEFL